MKFGWGKGLFDKPDNTIELEDTYFEKLVDTEKVWKIFNDVLNSSLNHIELDFTKCNNISNTGLTILAALGPLCESKERKISIEFGNKTDWTKKLTKYAPFTQTKVNKLKGIPFNLFKIEDEIPVMLEDLKLIDEISKLDPLVQSEIFSRLYELCTNASEHGKNNIGTVCNGTYDNNYLTFTVFDFGNGIKENVNLHLGKELSTEEAVRWAFKSTNSTAQSLTMPRGAGFTTTFDFVKKFNGQFILYTGDISCRFNKGKFYFKKLDFSVLGTLITVTLDLS